MSLKQLKAWRWYGVLSVSVSVDNGFVPFRVKGAFLLLHPTTTRFLLTRLDRLWQLLCKRFMSTKEGQLSRKLSISSLKSLISLSSLSNLRFANKSESSSFTSTTSTLPSISDDSEGCNSQSVNTSLCRDYPGQPGEEVQSRYILTRKLGKGNYSTVWLAKDLKSVSLWYTIYLPH